MTARKISRIIINSFKFGKKLLVAGNGGSASQASHLVAELVGKYKRKRKALPAISLNTDTSILTAIGNDYGFNKIFCRQLEALGQPGDVFLAISTSGKSKNILRALEKAKTLNIIPLELPRKGKDTPSIQEYQLKQIHKICGLVEEAFDNHI